MPINCLAPQNPWVNHAFYLGGTAQNAANLGEWEKARWSCGIKIFIASTGDLLSATDEEVEAVLAHGRRVVAVHAEDENDDEWKTKDHIGDSHDVLLHPV